MSRAFRCALLALFVITVCLAWASAQEVVVMPACSPGSPFFCVDAATYLEDDSAALEVYLEICNDALQFVKSGDGYRASADVTIVLFNDSGKQVAGDTYRVNLSSSQYGGTTSVDSCKVLTMAFDTVPGEYGLVITVADRDSRRKGVIEVTFDVIDFPDSLALSDIGFITRGQDGERSRWPGFRPNVRRSYGDVGEDSTFYYEIYNAAEMGLLKVAYTVSDIAGMVAYADSGLVEGAAGVGQYGTVPLDTLSNGQYSLEIAVLDDAGGEVVSRSGGFEVNREESYLGRDVTDAVALLTYIATSGFIDSFVEADVEDRRRLWEQFWREKDPTPATPRNEFYEEHLKRFRYANRNFSAGMTEGWRTDRGRIYILEGPPDEIESYSMEIDRNPTEVWFYFANGKRYIFVDETGFGDYVLVGIQ